MTLVTGQQFRGVVFASVLGVGLLGFSFLAMAFLLGWDWAMIARSIPSFPRPGPFAWSLLQLVVGGLTLALTIVGVHWVATRPRQPVFTRQRLASIQQQLVESERRAQQAEQRAAQAEANELTAEVRREVAQS